MISDKWFKRGQADKLTILRIKARRRRRLTYDCMNAVVQGNTVVCKRGHTFKVMGKRKIPGLPVIGVLSGMSSCLCRNCEDFDGEETE